MTDWHLNRQVGSEETAALFEAILQVDQVPALLQLVAHHQNLIPCFAFAAPQDLVVDQERKELVLDDVSLPHCKEDLFDRKEKHRCRDQKVRKVKNNSVNLNFVLQINLKIQNVAHLIHEAVFVDPPSRIGAAGLIFSKFVSSTVFFVQTTVTPEGGGGEHGRWKKHNADHRQTVA